MGNIAMNATSYGLTALNTLSPSWTPIIAVALAVGLGVTIFMVWKNFRRIIYGLGISVPIAILGWGSWSITSPAQQGNWKPLIWTGGIIGGLFLMMLIGKIAENLKFIKNIEKQLK